MNTHYLKFTGKVNIPDPLKNDTNYRIAIEWSIYNTNESSNQDWTYTNTYSFKPIHCLIHDELWETIKAKDIRSESSKFRSLMKYKFDSWELNIYWSFDDFYSSVYRSIYKNLDFIIANIK